MVDCTMRLGLVLLPRLLLTTGCWGLEVQQQQAPIAASSQRSSRLRPEKEVPPAQSLDGDHAHQHTGNESVSVLFRSDWAQDSA